MLGLNIRNLNICNKDFSNLYNDKDLFEIDKDFCKKTFCKDFLKAFQKSWNIKRMCNKYSTTFIRESEIDTGGVSQ